MRLRSGLTALGLVALAAWMAGCGDDGPRADARREVARLAVGDARDAVGLPPVYREDVVFDWRFRSSEDLEPWVPLNIDRRYELGDRGLFIYSDHPDPSIRRDDLRLDADTIDVIRIRRTAPSQVYTQIFWARDGEIFSEENSIRQRAGETETQLVPTLTYAVGDHPGWYGTITQLRIDPCAEASNRVEIMAVEGYSRRLVSERLAAAVVEPIRVELDGTAKVSMLAPPGFRHRLPLNVPKTAELELAYALQQDEGPEVSFHVAFMPARGDAVEVFTATLDPATASGRWSEAKVDLSSLSGRKGEMIFWTETPEPADLLEGFPVWGNPVVLARGSTDTRPNVLLIVVDTLRADHMSLYGYERPTSPGLSAWAANEAVVFESAVAPAPWTLPSHVSLFSGLSSLRHGVNHTFRAPDAMRFLAEELREHGYTTRAVTGGAFVIPRYGMAQGFDHFSSWQGRDGLPPEQVKDLDSGVEDVLAWMENAVEPFFFFFHTYQVHAPYKAWEPWFSEFYGTETSSAEVFTKPGRPLQETGWRFDASLAKRPPSGVAGPEAAVEPDELPYARALYDSGVAKTDQSLSGMLQQLEAMGLLDRTLVILTSDHGEGLGEHGSAGHSNLYDFNLMVPLVVAWPDEFGAGQRVKSQVRLVDVAPTVLEAAGIADEWPDIDGLPLRELVGEPAAHRVAESYAASSNWGIALRIEDRWKYIYQNSLAREIHGDEEIFDLELDPAEEENLALLDTERRREYFAELRRRYVRAASGLRVRLTNPGSEPFEVLFAGALAHQFTAKGFDLGCDCTEWRRGKLHVTVPSGAEHRLYFEGAAEGALWLELIRRRTADSLPARLADTVEASDLGEPVSFHLTDGGWQSGSRNLSEDEVGVEMQWQGSMTIRDDSPAEHDEELRRQLEALGYG